MHTKKPSILYVLKNKKKVSMKRKKKKKHRYKHEKKNKRVTNSTRQRSD